MSDPDEHLLERALARLREHRGSQVFTPTAAPGTRIEVTGSLFFARLLSVDGVNYDVPREYRCSICDPRWPPLRLEFGTNAIGQPSCIWQCVGRRDGEDHVDTEPAVPWAEVRNRALAAATVVPEPVERGGRRYNLAEMGRDFEGVFAALQRRRAGRVTAEEVADAAHWYRYAQALPSSTSDERYDYVAKRLFSRVARGKSAEGGRRRIKDRVSLARAAGLVDEKRPPYELGDVSRLRVRVRESLAENFSLSFAEADGRSVMLRPGDEYETYDVDRMHWLLGYRHPHRDGQPVFYVVSTS